jgi:hypothetical protein
VRIGTQALLRLRVLTLARLMEAATQASVFPRFRVSSFDTDAAFSDDNDLARRYGVLVTPAYLTWGAFDFFVPAALLCAYVEVSMKGKGNIWGAYIPLTRVHGQPSHVTMRAPCSGRQLIRKPSDKTTPRHAALAAPGGSCIGPSWRGSPPGVSLTKPNLVTLRTVLSSRRLQPLGSAERGTRSARG